jgi:hypothetical protein
MIATERRQGLVTITAFPQLAFNFTGHPQTLLKVKAYESDPTTLGGLNDDDASATFSPSEFQGTGCTNDVRCYKHFMWKRANITQAVFMESASEGESDSISKTSGIVAKPKTVQKSKTSSLEVKTNSKSKPCSIERASTPANSSSGNSDFNALPEFARSAWSTSFLPTLYDRLGQSPDPFVIDVDMVKAIQDVVDLAYPETDYQVRASDKIFNMVIALSFTIFFKGLMFV